MDTEDRLEFRTIEVDMVDEKYRFDGPEIVINAVVCERSRRGTPSGFMFYDKAGKAIMLLLENEAKELSDWIADCLGRTKRQETVGICKRCGNSGCHGNCVHS